jgi:hypothetical protein
MYFKIAAALKQLRWLLLRIVQAENQLLAQWLLTDALRSNAALLHCACHVSSLSSEPRGHTDTVQRERTDHVQFCQPECRTRSLGTRPMATAKTARKQVATAGGRAVASRIDRTRPRLR